ncbi:MAG: 16S rRNA (guanine(527)-N(7))-methyltransferase RsmG [Alphaproteobacteria bacterium]|nr:16S rRNA (guanine(527)-N(7))-methyltransferase RsmG [Alphaproteobacteria bacterium]
MTANYDRESFARDLNVSRETLARFDAYEALLRRWQNAINLIGEATLNDLWRRHFLDSGQLLRHLPQSYDALYDIGSGAGFPGLVLAILGAPAVHLVESNQRKCAFLQEAARLTAAPVVIISQRVETLKPPSLGWPARRTIVARAFAPLDVVLESVRGLIDSRTHCVMLKGVRAEAELEAARAHWRFVLETAPSLSEPCGVIYKLKDIVFVSST